MAALKVLHSKCGESKDPYTLLSSACNLEVMEAL